MANIQDEVEMLRRIPLFANVAPAKLKLLAFTSQRAAFRPGQDLFHQGERADAAYVIISGSAEILVDSPDGEAHITDVHTNAFVGEIAILCDIPRTATVRARDAVDTLRIDKEHFLQMLAEFPEMGIEIMRVLGERLTRTTSELAEARRKLPPAAR